MTTKDGKTYFYGTSADSRQDNSYGVFKWCLDKVEDTNGNYMTVSYTKDQGQIYIDTINYTGNDIGLLPSNLLKFYYEDRPDIPIVYKTKSEVKTALRLKTIDIQAYGSRAIAYKLNCEQSEETSRSMLSNVEQYDSDAVLDGQGEITGGTAFSVMDSNYAPEASNFQNEALWGTKSHAVSHYGFVDVNGDGMANYVNQSSNNLYVLESNKDETMLLSSLHNGKGGKLFFSCYSIFVLSYIDSNL